MFVLCESGILFMAAVPLPASATNLLESPLNCMVFPPNPAAAEATSFKLDNAPLVSVFVVTVVV